MASYGSSSPSIVVLSRSFSSHSVSFSRFNITGRSDLRRDRQRGQRAQVRWCCCHRHSKRQGRADYRVHSLQRPSKAIYIDEAKGQGTSTLHMSSNLTQNLTFGLWKWLIHGGELRPTQHISSARKLRGVCPTLYGQAEIGLTSGQSVTQIWQFEIVNWLC